MTARPLVEPLSHRRRRVVFLVFFLVFVVALPVIVFYVNGYRFDFNVDQGRIVSTGGLFVGTDSGDAEVFVDDELERDLRIFQQGTYIQNLNTGIHQVHVQQEGLETWVKEIPVQPFIVTEVRAFLTPRVPQVRLITQYETPNGDAVIRVRSLSEEVLVHASTTNVFVATTTINTRYVRLNPEYVAVLDLFASESANTATFIDRVADELGGVFELGQATSTATTTKESQNVELFEEGEEVYARWTGPTEDIPGYFCVLYKGATTTAMEYGEHVARAMEQDTATTTRLTGGGNEYTCRSKIRIDRKWQEVQAFDFLPDRSDLVLMHLEDGMYVVEIDDRGWQNTQILYPGEDLDMRIDGNRIYVRDGEYLLEIFTELQN